MVTAIANSIAEYIKKQNPEQTASVQVMRFALEGLINSTIILFIIIIFGIIMGNLEDCLLASVFFMGLRFVSGGYHFRSSLQCTLVSSCIVIFAAMFSLSESLIFVTTFISILILSVFAPSNIENHARIPKKYFIYLKMVSILIVLLNLIIMNSSVSIIMLLQALSTVNFTKRKEVKA